LKDGALKEKSIGKKPGSQRVYRAGTAIADVRNSRKTSPRTTRLIASGLPRMAQKVAEEATEVVIEAVRGKRTAVVSESVDLLYNLAVLWSELGISASEIWGEMERRRALLGMAEKLPKEEGSLSLAGARHMPQSAPLIAAQIANRSG
jgi:phosphoribosyl-ATP pyrophosphohydrolase